MIRDALIGLLLPFLGTSLGAAAVLLLKGSMPRKLGTFLNAAAAGIMAAASVFSLLLPAMQEAARQGRTPWLFATVRYVLGTGLLWVWDGVSKRMECGRGVGHSTRMLVLSVCLHNVPEGMAVGAAYAGALSGNPTVTAVGAFSLSLGIALQNLPEGAIISLPLHAAGMERRRAFACGVLSGASEPIAGALTVLLSRAAVPALPLLLSFAAGAMGYVVCFELLPETAKERPRIVGILSVLGGFALMTAMDVLLG